MTVREADGWNVAELAGGLLLSADDFSVKFDTENVDKLIALLNSGGTGALHDSSGAIVNVDATDHERIVLVKAHDKAYPDGIIVPVDVFTELEDQVTESTRPAFRRKGTKIVRGFRVTSGRRKGRVVANPATAYKPPVKGATRAKLRAAAHRNRLVRALKAKLTKKKPLSLRLRRMNHTD